MRRLMTVMPTRRLCVVALASLTTVASADRAAAAVPRAALAPASGPAGTPVRISARGLAHRASVRVSFAGAVVGRGRTTATGDARLTVRVPAGLNGRARISYARAGLQQRSALPSAVVACRSSRPPATSPARPRTRRGIPTAASTPRRAGCWPAWAPT